MHWVFCYDDVAETYFEAEGTCKIFRGHLFPCSCSLELGIASVWDNINVLETNEVVFLHD